MIPTTRANHAAPLQERVSYSAYGEAQHHFPGDLDGDGDPNGDPAAADTGAFSLKDIDEAGYNPDADIDRDGDVDSIDLIWAYNNNRAALAAGQISDPDGPGSPIGYAGYRFNAETKLYTVRFRHYEPVTGRWMERDPLDYVDGMNLLEYVTGRPLLYSDPTGQKLDPDPFCRHVGRPNCGNPPKGTTPSDRRYTTPGDPTGGPGKSVSEFQEIIDDLNSCNTKIPVCRLSEHGEEGLFHIPGSSEPVTLRELEVWAQLKQNPNADVGQGDRDKYNRLDALFSTLEEKCDKVYIEACNVGGEVERALADLYPGTTWDTARGTCTVNPVSGASTDWWFNWGKKLPW